MTRTEICNLVPLTRTTLTTPSSTWTPTPHSPISTPVPNNASARPRNLLEILDCASGAQDVAQIRFAIGLLLSDGCDLLRTLGDKSQVLSA
ncbi:hypothetical protein [Pseudomonas chlororaphis]|uniref:hypothetical protein n=1 Tax=Pseudomonas chlororaphis TaxID=587753 RepID=UPI001E5F8572|nr:hypothetical protein [Pseudomonas chlororaphis]